MSSSQSAMIVSGVPYEVTGVAGHAPAALSEFTGDVTMTTDGPTGAHDICGPAEHEQHGEVRVHEKDHHGTGRDVRVWTVSPATDHDGFVAAG